ncbi:MAG: hypothetical protein QXT01_02560 [Sulfolobales archaeon]
MTVTNITIQLPPKGYISRRFIELSAISLIGVKVVRDELVITNCVDLGESLTAVLNMLERRNSRNIFQTGNDRRYVTNKIALHLGLNPGTTTTTLDILKALSNIIKGKASDCIPKDLITTQLTTLNILKANFYEYGRTYLTRPDEEYISVNKLPIITQLLAILGVLIADVGRDEETHYYLLPPEGISGEAQAIQDILKIYNQTHRVLQDYRGMPNVLITLGVASSLVKAGYERDVIAGELVGIQESGKRATVRFVEPISTEGLISLINSVGMPSSQRLADSLKVLCDVAINLLRAGRSSIASIVVKIASDLIIYSRTKSPDFLYSAISLLRRLSDEIRMSKSEPIIDFKGRLMELGVERPADWLLRLTNLLIHLMEC